MIISITPSPIAHIIAPPWRTSPGGKIGPEGRRRRHEDTPTADVHARQASIRRIRGAARRCPGPPVEPERGVEEEQAGPQAQQPSTCTRLAATGTAIRRVRTTTSVERASTVGGAVSVRADRAVPEPVEHGRHALRARPLEELQRAARDPQRRHRHDQEELHQHVHRERPRGVETDAGVDGDDRDRERAQGRHRADDRPAGDLQRGPQVEGRQRGHDDLGAPRGAPRGEHRAPGRAGSRCGGGRHDTEHRVIVPPVLSRAAPGTPASASGPGLRLV